MRLYPAVYPRTSTVVVFLIILQLHLRIEHGGIRGNSRQAKTYYAAALPVAGIGKFAHRQFGVAAVVAGIIQAHVFIGRGVRCRINDQIARRRGINPVPRHAGQHVVLAAL